MGGLVRSLNLFKVHFVERTLLLAHLCSLLQVGDRLLVFQYLVLELQNFLILAVIDVRDARNLFIFLLKVLLVVVNEILLALPVLKLLANELLLMV